MALYVLGRSAHADTDALMARFRAPTVVNGVAYTTANVATIATLYLLVWAVGSATRFASSSSGEEEGAYFGLPLSAALPILMAFVVPKAHGTSDTLVRMDCVDLTARAVCGRKFSSTLPSSLCM